jgi:hypothetical protein
LGAVLIERCQAALKLSLLDGRQLHLVVLQAVPKLRDERKPFIRREAGDFVTGELHRSSLHEAKVVTMVQASNRQFSTVAGLVCFVVRSRKVAEFIPDNS